MSMDDKSAALPRNEDLPCSDEALSALYDSAGRSLDVWRTTLDWADRDLDALALKLPKSEKPTES